jgi:hypothetical protein
MIYSKPLSFSNNFSKFFIGRKLADKIRKEQAQTVSQLKFELSSLQNLVFEKAIEMRCSTCL